MGAKSRVNIFWKEFPDTIAVLGPVCIVTVDDVPMFLGTKYFLSILKQYFYTMNIYSLARFDICRSNNSEDGFQFHILKFKL